MLFAGFPLGGVLAGLLGSALIAAAGWRGLFIVAASARSQRSCS